MARRLIDARAAAVEVLTAVERGRTTLADELERVRPLVDSARDRGLLFELAAGTLRWQRAIDARVAAVSQRPLDALDPIVRAVVRIAVYQLRYLTRVPPHAVVHAAVEGTRQARRAHATGFVNAVLRSVQRLDDATVLPARPPRDASPEEWTRYLGITLSHPDWLVRRWLHRHGLDAVERWCQFNNSAPRVTLRVASGVDRSAIVARLADLGVTAEPAPFVPDALSLPPGGAGRLPADVLREVSIQDEGSQLVGSVAAARGGRRVLDLCASPGGKTMVLLQKPDARPFVVACDFRPGRVALLAQTLHRAPPPVPIVRLDAREPLPFIPAFDTVLIDAPCSGLGTLRRDPDLKWSRQEADLRPLADQALAMLERGADAVEPGGAVVYATCSSEPDENEDVVARFLQRHAGFREAPVTLPDTMADAHHVIDAAGHLRTWPFAHGLDAFFASVLVRA